MFKCLCILIKNFNKIDINTFVDNKLLMASILADTAKSTLQEQNSADSANRFAARPADDASQIVANTDPTELFAESASNWAQLAFAGNDK